MQQLEPDVLAALRKGEEVCGACLGHKRVVVQVFADFFGDRNQIYFKPCAECGATGLACRRPKLTLSPLA